MLRYLDLKGSGVFCKEVNKCGIVDDCVFNPLNMKVYSLIVKCQNFFPSNYLLPLKAVIEYGDEITYEGELYKITKKSLKSNSIFLLQSIIGFNVINNAGEDLGLIVDIMFDGKDGKISSLICSQGLLEDVVNGRRVVLVDNNVIFKEKKIIIDSCSDNLRNEIFIKRFFKDDKSRL